MSNKCTVCSSNFNLRLCNVCIYGARLTNHRKAAEDRPPYLVLPHPAASKDDSSSCSWPRGGGQRTAEGTNSSSSLIQSTGMPLNSAESANVYFQLKINMGCGVS